jgi:hypothetical protein
MAYQDPYAATAISANKKTGKSSANDPYAATAVQQVTATTVPTAAATIPDSGSLRPLTDRERFLNPDLYPVGLKDEPLGENLKNLAQRGGVGVFQLADAAMHPRQTVASILASLLPEPAVHAANKVVDIENRVPGAHYLTTHLPEGTTNPLQQAYQALITSRGPMEVAGKAAPLAGQALAGEAFSLAGPEIAGDLRAGAGSVARAATNTGAGPIKELVKETQAKNKTIDAVNADRLAAHEKATRAAADANAAAQRAYNQKVGQTIQQRRAVATADQTRRTAAAQTQVYGSQLIYRLNQLDRALRDRAGTMFDAVREKVSQSAQPPLPGTELGSAARAALSKVTGSSDLPKPFRDILAKYPESEPEFIEYQGAKIPKDNRLYDVLKQQGVGQSPSVTFKDLQGYYSETGAELAKGTLLGDVYVATRDLHNAVGNMMQEMADQAGAGKQFWDSRVFYRNYMDAFHEPTGPSGSGSPIAQTLLAKDPTTAVAKFSGAAGDRGVAILRRYDPALADLAQRAGAIKRDTAAATAAVPRTAKSITSIPAAKTTTVPPVELKPSETISSPDTAAARRAAAESRINKIENRGQWAATWPLFQAARALWGGHIPSIPTMGLESVGMLATVKATTHLLRYPPLLKFLEQARPEDIPLIPPELRGDLPGLVTLAQRQGIKVAPALVAAAAGTGNQLAGQPSQSVQTILKVMQLVGMPQ